MRFGPGYRIVCLLCTGLLQSQAYIKAMDTPLRDTLPRTTEYKMLDSVYISSVMNTILVKPVPDIVGTYIYAGKKTELINLAQKDGDITNKIARQLFVKVPGIFVYDMDGAGNQLNISARGLDPHRGWEFNIRKDGMITNSDMYGYPASHYSMPLESIERIQLVRGTGSLQYGAQFGGMLDYITKQGDSTKKFSFESINSAGSYKQLSSYNAIGGKIGRFRYYAYMYRKSRDGYRDNEHTDSHAEQVTLAYEPNSRVSVQLEWARSEYVYRIPGALTDQQFILNPRQATRARNYFNPDIHVPSFRLNWKMSGATTLQLTSSAVLGKRSSVMFDKPTNVADSINRSTMDYNNRQVDIDRFRSFTTELRLLHHYQVLNLKNTIAGGVQYMNNNLNRKQLGKGTTGSDFDLTLIDPEFGRDLYLRTCNIAIFAENNIQFTDKLKLGLGVRVEAGKTDLSGTIVYYESERIPVAMDHKYPLFGANLSYKASRAFEFYTGFSEAYRAMAFKDLIPSSTIERVDPAISDADGYNIEAGFRGSWKFLSYDLTGYLLRYNNRFGTLALTDPSGALYTWRTNTGNSNTKGLEMLIQANWLPGRKTGLSIFTSTSVMDARYVSGQLKSGNNNIDLKGKKVESAPGLISRSGITFRYTKLSISALYS
ncbi:MAG: TonB-dependent receptor, partial [Sphingobacteriales bacterium]